MITYKMTTIDAGTRIRDGHNTAANVLTSVGANVPVTGKELFIAPVDLNNSGGTYQYAGDKWVKITYGEFTGWMAYINKGILICEDFEVVDDTTVGEFPDSFIITEPSGKQAEYLFSRVLE